MTDMETLYKYYDAVRTGDPDRQVNDGVDIEALEFAIQRIAELEAEREQRAAEWSVMARACGNWRTWGKVEECPHTHPDWKVAARAIIERDAAFNKGMERAADMLDLNYPLCAKWIRKEIDNE